MLSGPARMASGSSLRAHSSARSRTRFRPGPRRAAFGSAERPVRPASE